MISKLMVGVLLLFLIPIAPIAGDVVDNPESIEIAQNAQLREEPVIDTYYRYSGMTYLADGKRVEVVANGLGVDIIYDNGTELHVDINSVVDVVDNYIISSPRSEFENNFINDYYIYNLDTLNKISIQSSYRYRIYNNHILYQTNETHFRLLDLITGDDQIIDVSKELDPGYGVSNVILTNSYAFFSLYNYTIFDVTYNFGLNSTLVCFDLENSIFTSSYELQNMGQKVDIHETGMYLFTSSWNQPNIFTYFLNFTDLSLVEWTIESPGGEYWITHDIYVMDEIFLIPSMDVIIVANWTSRSISNYTFNPLKSNYNLISDKYDGRVSSAKLINGSTAVVNFRYEAEDKLLVFWNFVENSISGELTFEDQESRDIQMRDGLILLITEDESSQYRYIINVQTILLTQLSDLFKETRSEGIGIVDQNIYYDSMEKSALQLYSIGHNALVSNDQVSIFKGDYLIAEFNFNNIIASAVTDGYVIYLIMRLDFDTIIHTIEFDGSNFVLNEKIIGINFISPTYNTPAKIIDGYLYFIGDQDMYNISLIDLSYEIIELDILGNINDFTDRYIIGTKYDLNSELIMYSDTLYVNDYINGYEIELNVIDALNQSGYDILDGFSSLNTSDLDYDLIIEPQSIHLFIGDPLNDQFIINTRIYLVTSMEVDGGGTTFDFFHSDPLDIIVNMRAQVAEELSSYYPSLSDFHKVVGTSIEYNHIYLSSINNGEITISIHDIPVFKGAPLVLIDSYLIDNLSNLIYTKSIYSGVYIYSDTGMFFIDFHEFSAEEEVYASFDFKNTNSLQISIYVENNYFIDNVDLKVKEGITYRPTTPMIYTGHNSWTINIAFNKDTQQQYYVLINDRTSVYLGDYVIPMEFYTSQSDEPTDTEDAFLGIIFPVEIIMGFATLFIFYNKNKIKKRSI